MKRVSILGSTGSIGRSALSVISRHRDKFNVVALTAHSNVRLLLEQINEFEPELVAVNNGSSDLKGKVKIPVLTGIEGHCEAASYRGADFVLSAIVGAAGLRPTIEAVSAGKTVGLANKESLVMAGPIVLKEASKSGSVILPVDSEHSAVFQCLEGRNRETISRVVLTASGGPFRGKKRKDLENATPLDALKHPSWEMGKKITVDSATLMNKGLEVIEAHYLFKLPPDRIEVIVHPQSIIHSFVVFTDGTSVAQMSVPDMKAPIAYALSYPDRLHDVLPPLDLAGVGSLTFDKPDFENFPCLGLAYRALGEGGTMPAVLNAANEVAVNAFLAGEIGFNDIPDIIKDTMASHEKRDAEDIDEVLEADRWARQKARESVGAPAGKRRP